MAEKGLPCMTSYVMFKTQNQVNRGNSRYYCLLRVKKPKKTQYTGTVISTSLLDQIFRAGLLDRWGYVYVALNLPKPTFFFCNFSRACLHFQSGENLMARWYILLPTNNLAVFCVLDEH